MKFVLPFLLSFYSACLLANTVRIYDVDDLVVTATSGISYNLNLDEPSGDATSEGAPATLYLPVQNAGSDEYLLNYRDGGRPLATSTDTTPVNFPLVLTITGSDKYLTAAVKVNSNYYVADRTALLTTRTDSQYTYSVSPNDFCTTFALAGSTNPCSDTTTFTSTMSVYFFVTTTAYAKGDQINSSADTGGVYFSLKLSNRFSSDIIVSTSSVRKGDKRVILNYTASATLSNFSKIKVFQHSALPLSDNLPVGNAGNFGSVLAKDFAGDATSGELTINELTNNVTYDFSVLLVDKYTYATKLSTVFSGTPTAIEELLKKQACYILTAGFGEEHFVTNYFRDYRDSVLAHSWLGKKLIRLYYGSAPKYALVIYQNDTLRAMVRAFAYVIYVLFRFGFALLIIAASCYYLNIFRKNKIFLKRNRL